MISLCMLEAARSKVGCCRFGSKPLRYEGELEMSAIELP